MSREVFFTLDYPAKDWAVLYTFYRHAPRANKQARRAAVEAFHMARKKGLTKRQIRNA